MDNEPKPIHPEPPITEQKLSSERIQREAMSLGWLLGVTIEDGTRKGIISPSYLKDGEQITLGEKDIQSFFKGFSVVKGFHFTYDSTHVYVRGEGSGGEGYYFNLIKRDETLGKEEELRIRTDRVISSPGEKEKRIKPASIISKRQVGQEKVEDADNEAAVASGHKMLDDLSGRFDTLILS
jgi:hypothetical protein